MVGLAGATLVALAGVLLSAPAGWSPLASAHLLLAAGVLPLVLGAIGYFTPSLTQTGSPSGWVFGFPILGLASGLTAVGAFSGARALLAAAIPLGVVAPVGLLVWMRARARAGLGDPHPCLRWYQASLVCLIVALLAAGAGEVWPAGWAPARRLHLHLNLLGFVGLAAVGTLHVLLPTVAGYGDPGVAGRLHRSLPFALVGVVLVAAGSALPTLAPLAYLGALSWLVPLGGLLTAVARNRGHFAPSLHGPGLPLVGALVGLALSLLAGAVGTELGLAPRGVLALFFVGFLFPLITGALAHLLPVWRWPGATTPARVRARRILTWGSGGRAALFPLAGVALAAGFGWAAPVAGVLLLLFLGQGAVGLAGGVREAEAP